MGIRGCWLCKEFKRGCVHVKKKVDEKQEQIDLDCTRDLVVTIQRMRQSARGQSPVTPEA